MNNKIIQYQESTINKQKQSNKNDLIIETPHNTKQHTTKQPKTNTNTKTKGKP